VGVHDVFVCGERDAALNPRRLNDDGHKQSLSSGLLVNVIKPFDLFAYARHH
jgi:hypothetical protein